MKVRQPKGKAYENISPTKGSSRKRTRLASVSNPDLFKTTSSTLDANKDPFPPPQGDGDDHGPAPLQLRHDADEAFQGAVILNNKSNVLGANAHLAHKRLLEIVNGLDESEKDLSPLSSNNKQALDDRNPQCIGNFVTLQQNEVLPTGTFVNMSKEPHAWALVCRILHNLSGLSMYIPHDYVFWFRHFLLCSSQHFKR